MKGTLPPPKFHSSVALGKFPAVVLKPVSHSTAHSHTHPASAVIMLLKGQGIREIGLLRC